MLVVMQARATEEQVRAVCQRIEAAGFRVCHFSFCTDCCRQSGEFCFIRTSFVETLVLQVKT